MADVNIKRETTIQLQSFTLEELRFAMQKIEGLPGEAKLRFNAGDSQLDGQYCIITIVEQ